MELVTGIFESRASATRSIEHLRELGVPAPKIKLLTPDLPASEIPRAIPIDDTERAGMGMALGAVLGGAAGLVIAFYFAPKAGFFPVEAGRVFFTLAAAAGGAVVGRRLEQVATEGIPHDDLHLLAEALQQGESVVMAVTESHEQAKAIRQVLQAAGGESLSTVRESWWLSLRETERAEYESRYGQSFEAAEAAFRAGFVAALHRKFRGRPFAAVADELRKLHGAETLAEDFRRGYARGRAYLHSCTWWVMRPAPAGSPSHAEQRRWW